MSKVDITKGMKVWMIDPAGAGSVVHVKKVTSFNFGGAPATEIDSTTMDNEEFMTSETGLKQPGAATLTVLHSITEPSHELLKDLEELGSQGGDTMFAVGFTDGTSEPTINSNGEFNFPTSRTFMAIAGWVQDWPLDIQLNSSLPIPVSIKRTGRLITSRKTAP